MKPVSTPGRRSHAERSAATRKHLIATAVTVIQSRSLEELSIHEIARSAGMTSGAVQHHFESKAVLMMHVLEELLQTHVDAGALWPEATLDVRERATRFIHTVWPLVYAQPRFIAAWNIYLGCRNQPEVLEHIARLRVQVGRQLEGGFFDAFPELASAPDRHAFLGVVLSTLRGLGLLQLFPDSEHDLPAEQPTAQLACLADLIATRCLSAQAPATATATRARPKTRRAPRSP
ncbi:TetR/AcrR family transcriptional regulator [Acidovorax sp. NCPPB 2350]|nr:TetR/AcrR family transcriptional regulator [Acidovorax sp. NCPPB 2350]